MKKLNLQLFIFLLVILFGTIGIAADRSFKAELSGSEVVPPIMTQAKGEATFQTGDKGLTYKLTASDIEGVNGAHIHQGKKGKNGPPVANLPITADTKGKFSGTLSEGTITKKDLMSSLKGKSIKSLIKIIESGDAYVNIHTEKNPAGEIRGQIK